jgi:K(+)-stimulated pyrophosphate-energized sodium pump
VTASKEGGASLNVLAGLTAGNFSAYWMGIVIVVLMGIAYYVTTLDAGTAAGIGSLMTINASRLARLRVRPRGLRLPRHGPGDHRGRLLRPGHRQRAVGLRALAHREHPQHQGEIKKDFGFEPNFEKAKHFLEENDGAGNTFKATAKPVLIGTAVVGATTMIFSIIMVLTEGLQPDLMINLSILHPPFLLGLITGGAMIYWFTGASTQAVSTGAYRAVEFIKANIKLDGVQKASIEDSKKVVEICTEYAQKGMFNIFLAVFFDARVRLPREYFFIGYLISIALFGLYQAIFMANAGGAWDNAKKVVETSSRPRAPRCTRPASSATPSATPSRTPRRSR